MQIVSLPNPDTEMSASATNVTGLQYKVGGPHAGSVAGDGEEDGNVAHKLRIAGGEEWSAWWGDSWSNVEVHGTLQV